MTPRAKVAVLLSISALLVTGWGHRALVARIDHALGAEVPPARPLSELPLRLDHWAGRDVPIDPRVLEAAHFDDHYLNRIYRNDTGQKEAGVFLGYVGRPRTTLGHRPDICMAAHGWEQTAQTALELKGADGDAIPAVLYEFRRPDGLGPPLLILATHVINGRFVKDPAEFSRYNGRGANLFGERPGYLARLQVSIVQAGSRDSDIAALRDITAAFAVPLKSILPYWDQAAPR
jgi:hypothetical protein